MNRDDIALEFLKADVPVQVARCAADRLAGDPEFVPLFEQETKFTDGQQQQFEALIRRGGRRLPQDLTIEGVRSATAPPRISICRYRVPLRLDLRLEGVEPQLPEHVGRVATFVTSSGLYAFTAGDQIMNWCSAFFTMYSSISCQVFVVLLRACVELLELGDVGVELRVVVAAGVADAARARGCG